MIQKFNLIRIILVFIFLFGLTVTNGQDNGNIPKHVYRPNAGNAEHQTKPDSNLISQSDIEFDSIRTKQIEDSVYARQIFVRDSLIARQLFIQDSIQKRKRLVDSLINMKNQLPKLLEAGIWMQTDQIISEIGKIEIMGDSALGNYLYVSLPLSFNQPYKPWISSVSFNPSAFSVTYDASGKKIVSFKAPKINWSFSYSADNMLLVINEPSIVTSKNGKKYYKQLFDSVFYSSSGKMVKIKRYAHFYQANDSYQKGAFLFTHLYQVRQFEYSANGTMQSYEIVNLCEKWNASENSKVCTITKYEIEKLGNSFHISRQNDPANDYSDGKFIYEFDNIHNLKWVSFVNKRNSENWKTTIELNESGNVYRYMYEVNKKTNNTLMFNYYLNDPKAKFKVEAISCSFEDDGVSYFQTNTTTGKSRIRDHFTLEWGPWQ